MDNELDMEAYHSEGIDPGEHKVFTIAPTIHTYNERYGDTFAQRFQGQQNEPFPQAPVDNPTPGLQGIQPKDMGPLLDEHKYWRQGTNPDISFNPENMPGSFESIAPNEPYAKFQPISERQKGPFDLPLEGGAGTARIGATTTREAFFKSTEGTVGTPEQVAAETRYVKALQRLQKEAPDIYKDMQEYLASQERNIGSGANKIKREMRGVKNYPPQEPRELTKEEKLLRDWYKNQFEGGPVEPTKLTLEEKIQAFQKKYGYDKKPISMSGDDVEFSRREERLLTEIPELRQKPFHPDPAKQRESDQWVESLSYKDYQRMLNGDLKFPE